MRASVFVRPVKFDALEVCSKEETKELYIEAQRKAAGRYGERRWGEVIESAIGILH